MRILVCLCLLEATAFFASCRRCSNRRIGDVSVTLGIRRGAWRCRDPSRRGWRTASRLPSPKSLPRRDRRLAGPNRSIPPPRIPATFHTRTRAWTPATTARERPFETCRSGRHRKWPSFAKVLTVVCNCERKCYRLRTCRRRSPVSRPRDRPFPVLLPPRPSARLSTRWWFPSTGLGWRCTRTRLHGPRWRSESRVERSPTRVPLLRVFSEFDETSARRSSMTSSSCREFSRRRVVADWRPSRLRRDICR